MNPYLWTCRAATTFRVQHGVTNSDLALPGEMISYSDLPMKWDLYSLQYIAGPGGRGLEVGVDVHEVRSRV